jgi:hypothetical protein
MPDLVRHDMLKFSTFLSCDTVLYNTSSKFRRDGHSYFFRLENIQVVGDRLKIFFPGSCTGNDERQ